MFFVLQQRYQGVKVFGGHIDFLKKIIFCIFFDGFLLKRCFIIAVLVFYIQPNIGKVKFVQCLA